MTNSAKELLFCEIAINLAFITKSQANKAIKAQRLDEKEGRKKKIGQYLLEMNLLTEDQIDQVLSRQFIESIEDTWGETFNSDEFQKNAPKSRKELFCDIALKLGYINRSQAHQALKAQRIDEKEGRKKKIGEYLLEMNLLKKDQITRVLSLQAVDSIEWQLDDIE